MLGLLVFVWLAPLVWSHGNMVWPPTWFDPRGEIGLSPGGFMMGGKGESIIISMLQR